TADTNISHLHQETLELPLQDQFSLHAIQLKTKSLNNTHPLHTLHQQHAPPRDMKLSLFLNPKYNLHTQTKTNPSKEDIDNSIKANHKEIVKQYRNNIPLNKISLSSELIINRSEEKLPRQTRVTLVQLRINKSPFLLSWKNHINPIENPSSQCPLANYT